MASAARARSCKRLASASARSPWLTCSSGDGQPPERLDPPSRRRWTFAPRPGHFPARARSVILLMQIGGPSQVDLFDPKPELQKRDGQKHPARSRASSRAARQPADGPARSLSQARPSAAWSSPSCCRTSARWPTTSAWSARCSATTTTIPRRWRCINTGKIFPGRPTLGSWVSYALGTREPEPARLRRAARPGRLQQRRHHALGERLAAGALPRHRDPVAGAAVLNLHPPNRVCPRRRAQQPRRRWPAQRGAPQALSAANPTSRPASATTSWRRACSSHAEQLLDLSQRVGGHARLYGLDDPTTANFGTRCLMARRLVESGRALRAGPRAGASRQACPGTITATSSRDSKPSARRWISRRPA